jgi:FlaA1/EpsC-like NDP-sugar epimerase
MGTSKLMGERLMTAANSHKREDGPIYASTRFGNVLGSSGSVVPIFHNQIIQGGPVTLTDVKMTRFIMSITEAVRLVIDSAQLAQGGEVFITKMPVVRIADLAQVMIRELAPKYGFQAEDIKIVEIGTKPGEKFYEELMTSEETRRAIELPHYFSVLPAFRAIYKEILYDYPESLSHNIEKPYISESESVMKIDDIVNFLQEIQLLQSPSESSTSRYWPGDKEAQLAKK